MNTKLICWMMLCVFWLSGFPRGFSIVKNSISPPSVIGSGNKLTIPRLMLMKATNHINCFKAAWATIAVILRIPTGPLRSFGETYPVTSF